MISTSDIELAKKQIRQERKKPIIVKAQDDLFNRKILEYGKFDILLFPREEKTRESRSLKQLNSGLNHVLAKIAAKNNISIGIDLEVLAKMEKKEKALQLSQIIQNIKVCRKAKSKITLINFKDKRDALDLMISLGASTQQAKDAVS